MPTIPSGNTQIFGKTITGADAAIGCTTPTQATATLTLAGNAVAGETFTIGARTYTWATSANSQTGNLVKVGAAATDSIDNAAVAINHDAGDGSLYSYNTPQNADVSAVNGPGDTLVITARQLGADGNGIAVSEAMSAASWGATATAGGASASLSIMAPASGVASWVRHSILLSASAQAIPNGAIYQYSVLTGTASDGTMSGLPAGYSDSSIVPVTTGFTITAAAASTVAVVWFTAT